MAEVNLTRRVMIASRDYRYFPVVISSNGRMKPGVVMIDGAEIKATNGTFYLEWYQDGKRVRKAVGKDSTKALELRLKQQRLLEAKASGIAVVEEHAKGESLAESIAEYLLEIKSSKKPKTYAAYELALTAFQQSCHKPSVNAVDRTDMLKFAAYLRGEGLEPRTTFNRFAAVLVYLKWAGRRNVVNKHDWPKFVEAPPEVYEDDELEKFFAACTPDERVIFQLFLKTGMREQEVTYLDWRDLYLDAGYVKVQYKKEYSWSPKAYKAREIPLATSLVEELREWRKRSKSSLVFTAEDNKPQGHFLRICKRVAKRAGLDEENWWLHKFRSSFATKALQNGIDIRTLQSWLGHSDLKSTLRYLRPSRGEEARQKMDRVFL